MIGLLVTLNAQRPIAAAQVEDGVVLVSAHVASAEGASGLSREPLLEVSGLQVTAQGNRYVDWLKQALVPGDEIEVLVSDIERPTPCHEELAWPDPSVACPTGIEVALNGVVVGTTGVLRSGAAAPAIVTWSRGAKTNPTLGEYVHLDVGLNDTRLLDVGDSVVIRMLEG